MISSKMPHRVTKELFNFLQNQNNNLLTGGLNCLKAACTILYDQLVFGMTKVIYPILYLTDCLCCLVFDFVFLNGT